MRRTMLAAAMVVLTAVPGFAADQTWSGQISDSMCGAKHQPPTEGQELSDAECTVQCVKGGSKYVLVADGKIYKIANQDFGDLATKAGTPVKVTGELSGDTVTVKKIEKQ